MQLWPDLSRPSSKLAHNSPTNKYTNHPIGLTRPSPLSLNPRMSTLATESRLPTQASSRLSCADFGPRDGTVLMELSVTTPMENLNLNNATLLTNQILRKSKSRKRRTKDGPPIGSKKTIVMLRRSSSSIRPPRDSLRPLLHASRPSN